MGKTEQEKPEDGLAEANRIMERLVKTPAKSAQTKPFTDSDET